MTSANLEVFGLAARSWCSAEKHIKKFNAVEARKDLRNLFTVRNCENY